MTSPTEYLLLCQEALQEYRNVGREQLLKLSRRLEAAAGVRTADTPEPEREKPGEHRTRLESLSLLWSRVWAFARSLSHYVSQTCWLLAGPTSDGPDAIVAVGTSRLSVSPANPRTYLANLTGEIGTGTRGRTARARIAMAPRVLLFDADRISGWWSHAPACRQANIAIIDGGYLVFAVLLALPAVLATLWRIVSSQSTRPMLFASPGTLRRTLGTVAIAEGIRFVLRRSRRSEAFFLTSNNVATEVLRWLLLVEPRCASLCEIQHGVPPVWEEPYYARLMELAAGRGAAHVFAPQVPDLPAVGSFLKSSWPTTAGHGINTFFNRYLLRHDLAHGSFAAFLTSQWQAMLPSVQPDDDVVVIAFAGTTSWLGDSRSATMDQGNFGVERTIMTALRTALQQAGRRPVIVYSPHPLLSVEQVRQHPFFREHEVVVHDSTMTLWFLSDLNVSLYSSTLFEFRYFGVPTFTPVSDDDGVYTPAQMSWLAHPGPGEGLAGAVSRFALKEAPLGRVSRIERGVERLRTANPEVLSPARAPRQTNLDEIAV